MRLVDCFCELFAFILQLVNTQEQQYAEARQVHERCLGLVENARLCCKKRGYEPQRFEPALFAVIVWIDEAILCSNLPFIRDWPNLLLQLHFFNTNNGGDEFYERLEQIDLEDNQLIEVFAYCFALGFHGRLYADTGLLEKQCTELYSRIHSTTPAKKLFPASYCGNERRGYKTPKMRMIQTAVLFLLPFFILVCTYIVCSYRLDVQLHSILGG